MQYESGIFVVIGMLSECPPASVWDGSPARVGADFLNFSGVVKTTLIQVMVLAIAFTMPEIYGVLMTANFAIFNLRPELVQGVAALGYIEPTPIQASIIPLMLNGADVIGQAQTGTGKTAAFALPILHNLQDGLRTPRALIVTPTRELALQVSGAFTDLGQYCQIQALAIYGGSSYSRQISQLKRGVEVVVGTPGRLLDLQTRGILDLSAVSTVVLDEADEMLSMGFIEDIEAILAATPAVRQTALFSATMPDAIRRLATKYMQAPQFIAIQGEQVTVAETEQRYYLVHAGDKTAALTRLFEVEDIVSALIFVRTRAGTSDLANELSTRGYPAEALNGDLNQEARERTLNRFRQGQIKVLVATDVAARGLDIEGITHVFNYDLPQEVEGYVHRIGRTGRAGKTGIAITLVTPHERRYVREIEHFTRQKLTLARLPTAEEIQARREAELIRQLNVWIQRGRCRQERAIVENLVAQGGDLLEIATAAVKLARAEEKQRPIAAVRAVADEAPHRSGRSNRGFDISREERHSRRQAVHHDSISHEPGMVRLSMSMGRVHGVRPADVVGAIAFHADIPGSTIGKILIDDQHTLVDVPENLVSQVLAKTGKYLIRKQAFTVERA
jgi:ATP-dependent RNA helicase DeaD